METVAVVIPARDASATLPAALDGLAAQTVRGELIVVDNGSRDATAELAASHPAVTTVVRRERGAGPGPARNAGAAASGASVLAFTDADCVPAPGWLEAGLRALAGADLVQGQVLPDPRAARHPWERTLAVTALSPLFETASLFVRRPVFDAVGGFSGGIATASAPFGEDVLFGWAARRAGARIGFAPEALVHHAVFLRNGRAFLAERRRLRFFCALVAAVPELRAAALTHRVFLTPRSRDFDLALAAVAAAVLGRRPRALAAALPYALRVRREARRWPGHSPARLTAVAVVADAVAAAALLAGSVRRRTPVL